MAARLCETCGRVTVHIGKSCFEHSTFPREVLPTINLLIPAYKAEVVAPHVSNRIVADHRQPRGIRLTNDAPLWAALGLEAVRDHVVKPGVATCSFCGVEVPAHEITYGMGRPRILATVHPMVDREEHTYEEDMRISAEKVVACKGCCLGVTVHVSKAGNKSGGVKFPEFD